MTCSMNKANTIKIIFQKLPHFPRSALRSFKRLTPAHSLSVYKRPIPIPFSRLKLPGGQPVT